MWGKERERQTEREEEGSVTKKESRVDAEIDWKKIVKRECRTEIWGF